VPIPTNLRETNQGIDGSGRPFIALAWSKAPGIELVEIERNGVIVQVDDNLAYRDVPNPAVVTGQAVMYRIRAVSGDQRSAWSAPITAIVIS